MFLFCGDSHARQFRTDIPGTFCTAIVSGSTIKGLANPESKSSLADLVLYMSALPRRKIMFLMLGGVDLDFSYYRALCLDGCVDDAEFSAARIEAYNQFLERLVGDEKTMAALSGIRILAPHATPLRDGVFGRVTAKIAGVDLAELRKASERTDLSHSARNRRIIAFNDRLQAGLLKHRRIKFLRIDREMVDDTGNLRMRFYPESRQDHHADTNQTLQTWSLLLEQDIPKFRRYADRERELRSASEAGESNSGLEHP